MIAPVKDVRRAFEEQQRQIMKTIKQRRIAQLRLIKEAEHRRYEQIAKWKAEDKKAREQGLAPVERPAALKDTAAYIQEVKDTLRRKFSVVKQQIQQRNTRSGGCGLRSNVAMYKPAFTSIGSSSSIPPCLNCAMPKDTSLTSGNSRRLAIQNFAEDPLTGRRRLVGLSELDVSRDVMDFKFITDSD